MIYFNDIFQRAFNLFDDPDISQKYYYDPAGFQQDMLDYLLNGKNKFTSPTAITDKLVDMDDPEGYVEVIDGEGTNTYTLVSHPHVESAYTYRIDGNLVGGTYDVNTNQVTFNTVVATGSTCSVT